MRQANLTRTILVGVLLNALMGVVGCDIVVTVSDPLSGTIPAPTTGGGVDPGQTIPGTTGSGTGGTVGEPTSTAGTGVDPTATGGDLTGAGSDLTGLTPTEAGTTDATGTLYPPVPTPDPMTPTIIVIINGQNSGTSGTDPLDPTGTSLTGTGTGGGSNDLLPNLVVDAEPNQTADGRLIISGWVTNVGLGTARIATRLVALRVAEDGTTREMASGSIPALYPGYYHPYQYEVARDTSLVSPRLRIRLQVDRDNQLEESSKSDNATDVEVPYGPDLAAYLTLDESGNSAAKSQTVKFKGDVANLGTIGSGSVEAKLQVQPRESDRDVCFANQKALGPIVAKYLADTGAAGSTIPDDFQKLVDKGYLSALPIDPGGSATDSYKNYQYRSNPPADGTAITCTVHGSADAPLGSSDAPAWADVDTKTVTVNPGEWASQLSFQYDGTAMAGRSVLFRLTIDPASSLPELSRQNNAATVEYAFAGSTTGTKPDIRVAGIAATYNDDDTLTLSPRIVNDGAKETGAFASKFFLGDLSKSPVKARRELPKESDVEALTEALSHESTGAGKAEEKAPTFKWTIPDDKRGKMVRLFCEADQGNKVDELGDFAVTSSNSPTSTNNTADPAAATGTGTTPKFGGNGNGVNNYLNLEYFVPTKPKADVAVETVETTVLAGGEVVQVAGLLKNRGATASLPFTVSWVLDGVAIATYPVPALPKGALFPVLPAFVPSRDTGLGSSAAADVKSKVELKVEGAGDAHAEDDVAATVTSAGEAPDLAVEPPALDLAEASDGSRKRALVVRTRVTNIGKGASTGYKYTATVDGLGTRSADVPGGLAAGASQDHPCEFILENGKSGFFTVKFDVAWTDPDGTAHHNENSSRISIDAFVAEDPSVAPEPVPASQVGSSASDSTAKGAPDLCIDTIACVYKGSGMMEWTVTVRNVGTKDAPAGAIVSFYRSNGAESDKPLGTYTIEKTLPPEGGLDGIKFSGAVSRTSGNAELPSFFFRASIATTSTGDANTDNDTLQVTAASVAGLQGAFSQGGSVPTNAATFTERLGILASSVKSALGLGK